jgi:hypothetical protein
VKRKTKALNLREKDVLLDAISASANRVIKGQRMTERRGKSWRNR